jgi:hypothetical protein
MVHPCQAKLLLDYQSYLQGKGVPRVPGKVVDRQGTTRKGRDYKTNQEGYYMLREGRAEWFVL